MKRILTLICFLILLSGAGVFSQTLNMDDYFAWCIVPFDNQNRTPEQRLEMLKNLCFTSYAYDWRAEHLPEMAKEISLARENGIEINAVWM